MGGVTEQAGDFALKDAAAAAQAFGSTANFTIRSTRSRDVRVLRIKDRLGYRWQCLSLGRSRLNRSARFHARLRGDYSSGSG